ELVRVVARALAKDPGARYQTGRELADQLQTLIRPGSSPTLRQSELSTTPGYVPGPTTYIPGSSPTVASPATQRGAPSPPPLPPLHCGGRAAAGLGCARHPGRSAAHPGRRDDGPARHDTADRPGDAGRARGPRTAWPDGGGRRRLRAGRPGGRGYGRRGDAHHRASSPGDL